ncbi:MAG: maleylacetoacetate isomerase [Alphaproteobacteria bacterium]
MSPAPRPPLPKPVRFYGYWRSSTAYRVRIALALKGMDEVQHVSVNLLAGEHKGSEHRERQPQGLVPAIELDNGQYIGQSLAILDYLDALTPDDMPPLTPKDPYDALLVREMAHVIALDVHPVNNLRLLNWLKSEAGCGGEQVTQWMHQWMRDGFDALDKIIARSPVADIGDWCFGGGPTLADVCLVPQAYNAERFNLSLEEWPRLQRIVQNARAHPAFQAAHPDNQPDATA